MLFPPLGIATLAGQLRRLAASRPGSSTATFADLRARCAPSLVSYRPDIVGISSMVSLTAQHAARRRDGQVETCPARLLVAGGPLPTVFPRRFAAHFDVVFRGEADLSFPRFCAGRTSIAAARLRRMVELPLDTYDGLFVPNHGLRVDNPAVHYDEASSQSFPLPDRSDFDHAAYQDVWLRATGSKVTSIIATLGCPFGCDFCSKPVFGNVVRRRGLDAVFAEIEQIRRPRLRRPVDRRRHLHADLPYLEEFCRRMAGRRHRPGSVCRAPTGIDAAHRAPHATRPAAAASTSASSRAARRRSRS